MPGVFHPPHPRRREKRSRWGKNRLNALTALYVLALALVTAANRAGPEHWAFCCLNLFLPQWLWGLPGLGLLPAARRARPQALALVACLLWVAGPLMGFCWHTPAPPAAGGARLRVMTYNVDQDLNNAAALQQIEDAHPDLLLVQEAASGPPEELVALHGWHVVGPVHGCLIASRLPLLDVQVRQLRPAPAWRQYLRCRIRVGARTVTVYDLHLDTPRWGLEALRREGVQGLRDFDAETASRTERAAGVAADLRSERGPIIVAGDLNAPVQSLVCRALTGTGLRDAFSASGRGYGYTYGHRLRVRQSYVRIDHILTSREWRTLACWTGGTDGSDHSPVIADLFLAGR